MSRVLEYLRESDQVVALAAYERLSTEQRLEALIQLLHERIPQTDADQAGGRALLFMIELATTDCIAAHDAALGSLCGQSIDLPSRRAYREHLLERIATNVLWTHWQNLCRSDSSNGAGSSREPSLLEYKRAMLEAMLICWRRSPTEELADSVFRRLTVMSTSSVPGGGAALLTEAIEEVFPEVLGNALVSRAIRAMHHLISFGGLQADVVGTSKDPVRKLWIKLGSGDEAWANIKAVIPVTLDAAVVR